MKNEHLAGVERLARQAAALQGFDLVGVELSSSSRDPVLRLFIDKEGGVSLDDCVRVSRAVGEALDTEDPIPFRYRLVVSSPGVDRPLKGQSDFERYAGQPARLVLRRSSGGGTVVKGRIGGCTDEAVNLRTASGEEISVKLEDIARARLDVDPWEMARMKRNRTDAR